MPPRFAFSEQLDIERFQSSPGGLDAIYRFSPLWNIGIDGAGITVAILDTGINANLLSAAVTTAADFTGENNPSDHAEPVYQHGTAVARAVLTIARQAKLANLKVVPHRSRLTREPVCRAIEHCIEAFPAYPIINISLAFTPQGCSADAPCSLCQSVQRAIERGITVVASAPNTSEPTRPEPLDAVLPCPARCEGVVVKRAPHTQGFIEYWQSLSVWQRWLIKISGRYGRTVGHSFTAGYTSGCAALLLSAFPEASPSEIRSTLLEGGMALDFFLNDSGFIEAKSRIIEVSARESSSTGDAIKFIHDLGFALSYIEYRLLMGFQTKRGVTEFRMLQRIVENRVPSALQSRFAEVHAKADQYELAPRLPSTTEMLNEVFGVRRFSRIEEGIIAREHDIMQNPRDVTAWYQKGFLLQKRGLEADAVLAFEEAVSHDPADENGWYWRAKAFFFLGRNEEALDAITEMVRRYPGRADVFYGQGVFLSEIKEMERALDAYDNAIQLKPDLVQAWRGKAEVLQSLGRVAEAEAASDVSKYLYPPLHGTPAFSEAPDFAQAFRASLSGDYREMARWSGRPWTSGLYTALPVESLVLWGQALSIMAEAEQIPGLQAWAVAMWDKALKRDPSLSIVRKHLVSHFLESGDLSAALAHNHINPALGSTISADIVQRAWIEEASGNLDSAELLIRDRLRTYPGSWIMYLIQGRLCSTTGKSAEALVAIERACEISPAAYPARLSRARQLAHLERWNDAAEEYAQIAERWPNNAEVYYEYGNLYWRLGFVNEAVTLWKAAIQLVPESVEFRLALFRSLAACSDTESAEDELSRILALRPAEFRVYAIAAEFYYSIGKLMECERELKHALWRGREWAVNDGQPDQWGRDDLRPLALLLRVLREQQRGDEAAHILQLIRRIDPGYTETTAVDLPLEHPAAQL